MAFTLAHPAAALPLMRLLGRHGVRSALVVGSMVPDFWYVVPFADRNTSHMAHGLVSFCLPVGLVLYWVWHQGLKRPLATLLPPRWRLRLREFTESGLPSVSWWAVAISVLAGAASHQLWDTFTHSNGTGVRLLPPLQWTLFSMGDASLRLFHVLQIVTSAAGLALVLHGSMRALQGLPARGRSISADRRPSWLMVAVLVLLAASAAVVGCVQTLQNAAGGISALAGALARSLMGAATVAVFAYCAAWHLGAARGR